MTAKRIKFANTIGFICLSTLLLLLGVPPEFKTSFVSKPVYITMPMTHAVFLSTVPRSIVFWSSTEERSSPMTTAALSLCMNGSGLSQSISKALLGFAQSAAVRIWVSTETAFLDLRFVSPSRFFVSTNATFSSSLVAQIMISAGIACPSLTFTMSPTLKSSHVFTFQCGASEGTPALSYSTSGSSEVTYSTPLDTASGGAP